MDAFPLPYSPFPIPLAFGGLSAMAGLLIMEHKLCSALSQTLLCIFIPPSPDLLKGDCNTSSPHCPWGQGTLVLPNTSRALFIYLLLMLFPWSSLFSPLDQSTHQPSFAVISTMEPEPWQPFPGPHKSWHSSAPGRTFPPNSDQIWILDTILKALQIQFLIFSWKTLLWICFWTAQLKACQLLWFSLDKTSTRCPSTALLNSYTTGLARGDRSYEGRSPWKWSQIC